MLILIQLKITRELLNSEPTIQEADLSKQSSPQPEKTRPYSPAVLSLGHRVKKLPVLWVLPPPIYSATL